MKLKRIMIAAPKSGSGKTTITCAMLQTLKNMGQQVISYKCGPDYIDPMFHEKIIKVPAKNLDTFFTDEEHTISLFLNNRTEEEFAVLEGVMGLFDGLGGINEEGSSYHLAKVTKTPIILVVDAKGMGRSILPLLAGFLAYDKEQLIQGVILNRMSKGYFEIIKPLVEKELKICVVGYIPECKELHIKSRHLGLVMPNELADIKKQLQDISEHLIKTISIEKVVEIAEYAPDIEEKQRIREVAIQKERIKEKPVIAVAMDEAFCFYYADNLFMLEENGAELKYFSPLYDKELPDGCNALLLGGGYPELHLQKLSENRSMRTVIKQAIDGGMPVVAECGGFMYLHSAIIDKTGTAYAMAGVLPATCLDTGKLVRFGYIEIKEKQSCFLPEEETIKGHEFHYYDSTENGENCSALKPVTGREYSCVIERENCWMGFPHLYYPSNPAFAKAFVDMARKDMKKRAK